jgi:glycosyltransferase involved in cell wall biosynthesis
MYNRQNTIERCVNSVLSQSYTNIEVLVIDDTSTDNSVAIVNSIKDGRVRLIVSDKKVYAQGARNLGIRNARGNWIVFLDSDDKLTTDSILNRYNTLERYPDIDFIYGDPMNVHFNNLNNETIEEFTKYIFKELCLCAFSEMMVKKSSLEKVGFLDEKYKAWQDDSLVISFVKEGFTLRHCECIVAEHFSSDNQITSSYKNKLQGVSRIVSIYKQEIIATNGYFRYFLWQLRILLNYLETKENTYFNRKMKNLLRKYLLTKFEHIWG